MFPLSFPSPFYQNLSITVAKYSSWFSNCIQNDVMAQSLSLTVGSKNPDLYYSLSSSNYKTDRSLSYLVVFQMVSVQHTQAEYFFDRDVTCLRDFFRRRFNFESEDFPVFSEVHRVDAIDAEVSASGITREMEKDLVTL